MRQKIVLLNNMQPKQPIEDLLRELETLYNNSPDPNHQIYYSKLALLELCGWLEIVFDEIALTYATAKLADAQNIELLEKEIVGKVYGCTYKEHFRSMLIRIIGITKVETFENTLRGLGILQILIDQPSSLWAIRKRAAHTTVAGVTPSFQTPSTMRTYLNSLHPILTTVETELNNI